LLAYPVADTLDNDLGERYAGTHTKTQNNALYVSVGTLIDQKESFSVKIGSRPCPARDKFSRAPRRCGYSVRPKASSNSWAAG